MIYGTIKVNGKVIHKQKYSTKKEATKLMQVALYTNYYPLFSQKLKTIEKVEFGYSDKP